MTGKRNIGSMAAIGGSIAAIALLAGLPTASADELADLRANQELLQKRIDQLSQAPPPAPGPYVPGFGPETRPPTAPVTVGSFPRSFLIPGTETSLRIGGIAWTDVVWYMQGAAQQGGELNGQGGTNGTGRNGPGGTGNLASIPLNNSIAHSRSGASDISSRASRLLFDARTPTAWGQVRAYLEMDFSAANETVVNNGVSNVTSGWVPRLRKAYGTIGGLLAGQDTGSWHDPDADAELLDFGGGASSPGRARVPQVKYTYQGAYGTVWTAAIENPEPQLVTRFGSTAVDNSTIGGISTCSATANTAANLPATTACVGSSAFFNPLQSSWPELTGTARINQPWGHLQVGLMARNNRLNDGQYLNQDYLGYAGTISGDVHPFTGTPGPLGKDDLGFVFAAGTNVGGQFSNGVGPGTNFGSIINVPGFGLVNPLTNAQWNTPNSPTRRAYDRLVRTGDSHSVDARLWYQHWWTENLRSTADASAIINDINTNLVVACGGCNKQLSIIHLNLIWSPVAFVDLGIEGAWGHRIVTTNFKGDSYTLQGGMRVRF